MNHSRQAVEKRSMLPIKDLEKLIGEADSGIYKIREEVHVALHPRFSSDLRVGLLNYFNSQINKWHKELNGILAGYGKLQVKSPMGQMINEEPYFHLDVVSDFWVFRPDGAELRGLVTKKSQSHISCLVHGIFNVPCYKPPEQKSGWATNVQLDSQVKLKVIKTDMSQPVPYILGSFLGLVGANDKAPDAIDSPVQIVEPSQWPQAVASGVLPSTPSKESPKPKQKRAPAKKAAATAAQPAQNGLPQLPTQPLPAVPQVTATLPAATATPPKGRKKAAAKNSEPPAVTPAATVVAAVPQLPTQPLPAAAATQQTLAAPATPKGRKKATPKKAATPTAPVVPAPTLDSLIQAPDVVSLIQSLQQPVAPAVPQQPVPPAEITPKSRKKPTKKASQPSTTPNNLTPAAATSPLVTAVAQPPAPARANINQMLSSLAPMQPPTAPSPATVPAAESAPSASPSKKAKKRKKDEVDAAIGTPSRSQSLKEETVSPPPQTPVSSVPPHLINGGGVGGPMNSTEMATPDSASQGVNGKKSKKKKRHISDMEDHPPATPIAMPSLDDGAYGDGETPAKKKKKKKDKKRDGDEGQPPSAIQNETAVSNIMDDSSAATSSSKKSKKKKKKSEQ